jgi:hypothetical protein
MFSGADRSNYIRHLEDHTGPLLGDNQIEKNFDAKIRWKAKESYFVKQGQLYRKLGGGFEERQVIR